MEEKFKIESCNIFVVLFKHSVDRIREAWKNDPVDPSQLTICDVLLAKKSNPKETLYWTCDYRSNNLMFRKQQLWCAKNNVKNCDDPNIDIEECEANYDCIAYMHYGPLKVELMQFASKYNLELNLLPQ